MNDHGRFATLMSTVCAAHRVEATEALLEAYWIALQGVSDDAFAIGAARAVRDCRWMPKPIELRELCGEETAEMRAVLAFEHVRRALFSPGTYASVRFDDPAITATIRALGGWVKLGQQSEDEFQKWTRKEFFRLYEAYSSSAAPLAGERDYLAGIAETTNAAAGREVAEPVLIRTRAVPEALPGAQQQQIGGERGA